MLVDYSNEIMMSLLVNKTRQAELSGSSLAEAHRDVGKRLAGSVSRYFSLEDVAINHVAGNSTGVKLRTGAEPIVVAVMRAGLFVAEGIWSSLPGSALALYSEGECLDELPARGRPVIIVDSVINTGQSIRDVLCAAVALEPSNLTVAALVAYRPNLESLVGEFPAVDFHIARVSDRSYVGRGSTDTGARLFGTTSWASEA